MRQKNKSDHRKLAEQCSDYEGGGKIVLERVMNFHRR